MVGNYIKIGIRQLRHQNIYSLVSLFGITLSITCSILLFLYLRNEFSFDRYDSSTPVYRIIADAEINGNKLVAPTTPSAVGPALPFTHVRIRTQQEAIIQYKDRLFHENDIYTVDDAFFDIFPLELLQTMDGPLLSKNTIVLTESLAEKIFGDASPIGEKVYINRKARLVSGVVQDPYRSHLNFSGLVIDPSHPEVWTTFSDYTYIKTNASPEEVEAKLAEMYDEKMEPFFIPNNSSCTFSLQPVEDIHLHSDLRGELDVNGNPTINFALLLIGIFMILVAGINYTNLSTTRVIRRAKEIAIRKAVGSYRKELVYQFIVESVLLVFFGVFLSLIAIDIIFPYLHFVAYPQMYDISIYDWELLGFITLIVLVIGLMGSVSPALEMSRFNVTDILHGTFNQHGVRINRRRILLFVQFSISIGLIICTWVIRKQINYVQEVNLGYNPHHLISVIIPEYDEKMTISFLEDLKSQAAVQSVSTSETIPGEARESLTSFYFNDTEEQQILVKYFHADESFIQGLEIELLDGNGMQKGENHILINETLAKRLNNPLGVDVEVPAEARRGNQQVSGIIKDIHLQSLRDEIQPLAILYRPLNRYALIRLNQANQETLGQVKEVFAANFPDFPFDYQFVEDRVARMYERDVLTGRLFGVFAILTTCLALMGMFALSFYTSEIRKQEIGIRKINGASTREILLLVNKEYFYIVMLSALVAVPVSYFFLQTWLHEFVYRISLGGSTFILVLILSLIISMGTVSINTLKAAHKEIIYSIKR